MNESHRVESCFTTNAAGWNRGCARDASAPGPGRIHGTHRPDLLPGLGRTHPSGRPFAGTSAKASPVSRSAKNLDNLDFTFNPKMNRSLVFDLATAAFIARHEDSLFVGPYCGSTCGSQRPRQRRKRPNSGIGKQPAGTPHVYWRLLPS